MFFVSGAASLIYQIIWIRKFSLVLGGTVFSMSVVISTFMAGIAIGAAVLGRLADRVKAPLMLYAAIELAIGALASVLNRMLHSAAVAVFPDWSNERAYVEGADSTVVL